MCFRNFQKGEQNLLNVEIIQHPKAYPLQLLLGSGLTVDSSTIAVSDWGSWGNRCFHSLMAGSNDDCWNTSHCCDRYRSTMGFWELWHIDQVLPCQEMNIHRREKIHRLISSQIHLLVHFLQGFGNKLLPYHLNQFV